MGSPLIITHSSLEAETGFLCAFRALLFACPQRQIFPTMRLLVTLEMKGYAVGCPVLRGFILCMKGAGQECSFIFFFTPYLLRLGQKEKEEPKVTFSLVLFQEVENGRVWAVHHGHVSLDDRNSPKGQTSATMFTAHALGTPQQPPTPSPRTHFLLAHSWWARSC